MKKVITLLIVQLLFWGCQNRDINREEYFEDFNPVTRMGINKKKTDDVKSLSASKKILYKIKYKRNKIDSIIILNALKGIPQIKIKVLYNDSVTLYNATYRFQDNDNHKSYCVVYKNEAIEFSHLEQENWMVVCLRPNMSFGGPKIIDDIDTLDFERKLLNHDSMKFTQMPGHKIHSYTERLNSNFTFNRWLNNKIDVW